MRALRGRAGDIDEDRAVTQSLVADTRETGEPAVRVWTPHRQVAFGRRDARSDGYERAWAAAEERGFPPYERRVGGRAVAYTGNTLAFARVEPLVEMREGLTARYDEAVADLRVALADLGVTAERGEPPDSYCPGSHSLSTEGKIVGIAQRVQRGAALVAGICVVRDHEAIATVLDPVYAALDVPFDPTNVGSVARAGGPDDPETVARAIERALAGEEVVVERVR
ncbi:lipoate--protein ligase family protein [Halomarina litorea]|uniref:lipoate--protein ligase family protein n=1 Tax=Halomarina litorea TaxID=2961595 RepID=UPI0020C40D9D|nr:lipoate--protein ligase family protein [Halomarina sp. BCD28]